MIQQKYRFFLRLGENGQQQAVHPVWKDDLALEYQRESNQMFYRASLSGSLVFIREDYELITDAAFDTAFFVDIERSANGGTSWIPYWTGRFYQTDCTINVDNKRVTVKPTVYDRYTKILAGMEKEYDLIRLTPAIQPVTVIRRPVLQVYTLGEDKITNVLSTMSWEQDCTAIDNRSELTSKHFGEIGSTEELTFTSSITGLTQPFTGSLGTHGTEVGEWDAFTNSEGVFKIKYFQEMETVYDNVQYTYYINGLRIYNIADGTLYWEFEQRKMVWIYGAFDDLPATMTFENQVAGYSDITGNLNAGINVFARLVMAVSTFQGQQCYEIPADDIVPTNRNLRYCMPYTYGNILLQTTDNQVAPTEWGVRSDGKYYVQPTSSSYNTLLPVGRSFWGLSSSWVKIDSTSTSLELAGRKETQIRDAFSLEACISALLSQIDPSLSFAASDVYSVFLYGTNPIWNNGSWGRLFVTPKSNILVSEYSMPARKAECTLKNFLDMLRMACGLYWFIDDSNHLRIEHIKYFKNGGTYSGSMGVGINLNNLISTRNGKSWSYGVNEYKFDKVEMAERYQYGWMDDTTKEFAGYPIEVLSGYVEEGKIEEVTVGMFNSDIDYMMTEPSNVSSDGFALLNCVQDAGLWKTQIRTSYVDGRYNTLQNWQMSFILLQPQLLLYDMPARSIKVNNVTTQALGIQRKKQQQVSVPLYGQDPSMTQLIQTGLGKGEVKKMSINLLSRMAKTTLVYDTE